MNKDSKLHLKEQGEKQTLVFICLRETYLHIVMFTVGGVFESSAQSDRWHEDVWHAFNPWQDPFAAGITWVVGCSEVVWLVEVYSATTRWRQ